eukprot:m51a1_g11505 hypothetical protein (143) ;mRNA; r:1294-2007
MLQSKGALYNDFFKSEQNCKKMSLIATKIIEWRAEDQNKLFDEVSKIPGIDTVSITSFEMSSLWKHPVEAVLSFVSKVLGSHLTRKQTRLLYSAMETAAGLFEKTTEEVDIASTVIEKEIVLADPSEKKRLNWNKALYPAEV